MGSNFREWANTIFIASIGAYKVTFPPVVLCIAKARISQVHDQLCPKIRYRVTLPTFTYVYWGYLIN